MFGSNSQTEEGGGDNLAETRDVVLAGYDADSKTHVSNFGSCLVALCAQTTGRLADVSYSAMMPADIQDRFSVLPLQCLISHVFNYSSIIIWEQTGVNYRLEAINGPLSILIRFAKLEEMILIVSK